MGEGQDDSKSHAEWKETGNDLYKKGDYKGAISSYSEAIKGAPEESSYYGNRAASYMMLQQFDEVIRDCDKAISLSPDFIKAYIRKSKALASMGKLDEALSTLRDGLVRDPNNKNLLDDKAEVENALKALAQAKDAVSKERYTQANILVNLALNTAPQSLELKMLKMECLMGLKKYDEALSFSTPLMRSSQAHPNFLYWRAQCLYSMCNFDSAVKHLQQAIRGDPDNSKFVGLLRKIKSMEAKKKEGDEAFKAHKNDEAIAAWSEALAMDPHHKAFNAKLYYNRAFALSKLRRHQEAVKDCDKAIDLDPAYIKAYHRRASSLYALGGVENLEKCIRDYEEVAKLSGEEEQRDIRQKIHQTKIALKRAKRKDFYKILGVTQDATDDEIRKAYRKMALKYHPDRHTSSSDEEKAEAEKIFKDIAEAYEILSDKQKRDRYDSGVDLEDLDNPYAGAGGCGGMGGMHGIDPSMIFQMFMQSQGGMGGGMGGFGGMGGMGGMGGGGGGGPGGVRFHFG